MARARSAAPVRRRAGRRAGRAAPAPNATSGVQDSSTGVGAGGAGRPPRPRPVRSASSAPRASSQARTSEGIALVPFGATATRPMVATAPCSVAASRAAQHGGGQPEHRVVAVDQPGGAGVVGLAVEVEPPPAVRPDAAARRRPRAPRRRGPGPARRAARRRCRPGAASRRRGRAASGRARPRSSPRPASCRRRRAGRGPGPASSAPVSSREPAQAMPNRAPSSSVKLTTASGRAGRCAAARSRSTAANAADDTERAVEGTAVRHRVEVAAGHDPAGRRRRGRPTTPTGCRCGRPSGPGRGARPRRRTTRGRPGRQGVQAYRR